MFVSRAFPHRNPSRPAALLNLTIKISQTSQPQYPTPSRARATGPNFHVRFRTMTSSSSPGTDALLQYTACDIADALLALKVPNAGFLPDLHIRAKGASRSFGNVTIAPASTVLMVPKDGSRTEGLPEKNVPAENHWVDLTQPETIVVIQQPKGQICAVLGGIMGLRMSVLKAKGVVVYGRVRDVEQLNKSGLLIWSKGTSIVGTGMEAKPHAVQVPLNLDGTIVKPGDIVFCDDVNGIVVIPQERLSEVISLLPRMTKADQHVEADVEVGMTVKEAFKKHRPAKW